MALENHLRKLDPLVAVINPDLVRNILHDLVMDIAIATLPTMTGLHCVKLVNLIIGLVVEILQPLQQVGVPRDNKEDAAIVTTTHLQLVAHPVNSIIDQDPCHHRSDMNQPATHA